MEFIVNDVNYKFDDEQNKLIPNYDWFVNYFKSGEWEKDTFEIFDEVKDSNKVAVDIGAWIGATSIWLSKNFKNVISIEADKEALTVLKSNLKNNHCENVIVIEKAIFNDSVSELFFGKNKNRLGEGHGDSTSQAKTIQTNNDDYTVSTVTLYEILKQYDNISFIKIDIEGGEEMILEDLFTLSAKNNLKIWVSFHYDWWVDKNLDRFNHLLGYVKSIKYRNQYINKSILFDTVKLDPFSNFFIEF